MRITLTAIDEIGHVSGLNFWRKRVRGVASARKDSKNLEVFKAVDRSQWMP